VLLNTANATGSFVSSAVGNGVPLIITGLTISGAQAGDYQLNQPVTIAANILPSLVNKPLKASVGTPIIITGNLFKADLVDSPSTVVYTLVGTPTNGILQDGTTVLTAGSTFSQADIYAGKIKFTGSGGGPASFQFTATDGHWGTGLVTTFSINVIPPTISNVNSLEGTFGFTPFTFTVRLPSSPTKAVTFDVYTTDGSAKAGVNYIGLTAGVTALHSNGTVTFAAGQVVQKVTVYVLAGTLAPSAGSKTFTIHLSNPTSPDVSIAVGTGQIIPQLAVPVAFPLNAYPPERGNDVGMNITSAILDMVFAEMSGDKKNKGTRLGE